MASLLLTLQFLLMPSPSLVNLAHHPCFCLPVSCRLWPLCVLAISPWGVLGSTSVFSFPLSTSSGLPYAAVSASRVAAPSPVFSSSKLSALLSLKHNLDHVSAVVIHFQWFAGAAKSKPKRLSLHSRTSRLQPPSLALRRAMALPANWSSPRSLNRSCSQASVPLLCCWVQKISTGRNHFRSPGPVSFYR